MFPSKHALAQGKAASPSRPPPDPRTHLRVGSGPSQLILSLLVVGFSLTPGLAALVPVVPRDACVWERGRKPEQPGLAAGQSARSRAPRCAGCPHAQLSKVGFPTTQSGVCSIPRCHHPRAARPAAAMLARSQPGAPEAAAAISTALAHRRPLPRLPVAHGRAEHASGGRMETDGARSPAARPGPQQHSPIARRWLERGSAKLHGPVSKTQPRLLYVSSGCREGPGAAASLGRWHRGGSCGVRTHADPASNPLTLGGLEGGLLKLSYRAHLPACCAYILSFKFFFFFFFLNRAWWRTPLIPALGRQRQANF